MLSKFDSNFSESVGIKVELNHSACTKTAMISVISENIFRFQMRLSQPTKESYLHCVWLPWVSDDGSIFECPSWLLHIDTPNSDSTFNQVGHSYEGPPYIIKQAASSKC